ncbi:hypothetical protein [Clostridium perfringens]|uniref:hypothetical protein n=1 Tax=Clostridium perfringens TaxID=1502 RepID=UPI0024BC58F6|nr:hypothetical protein [Clostridium perfringens]MDU5208020.1 hypothetical protein [Clostridioides difficile]
MRIMKSCVSSETIKELTNSKRIIFLQSLGYYIWLLDKKNRNIGYIVPCEQMYLGDDVIIKEIIIDNNEKLSKELTNLYRGKILIFSIKDEWS